MTEQSTPTESLVSSDVLIEYAAVREGGAGLIDLSTRGRLLVNGSEAVPFLNGLVTNDLKTLAQNHWLPAVFPNVQGRMIASVRITHRPDGFLIDTEAATSERVRATVSRFTMAGDFRVTELSEQTAQFSVQGAQAATVVARVGESIGTLDQSTAAIVTWNDTEITVIKNSARAAVDLIVDADQAAALRAALIAAGARPVGPEAQEILRIEAGEPRFGIDMDENNVVSETNLDEAISFTKGCYIGQEIIARIKYRGHVAKKLTGILLAEAATVDRGATIKSVSEKEIGRITSATYSPQLGRTVALGYVKYDFLEPGTVVKVAEATGELAAVVTALPFIPA